jgi:hypothetical protein
MAAAALLALLLTQGPSPSAPPCAAPEYRQFDFWVGDWVVHNPKGEQVGTSRIEKIENGCGILEMWTNARGIAGRSINIYRRASRTWAQAWAGSDGLTLTLEGRFAAGRMVLHGESLGPQGERVHERVTWSLLKDGKVRQFWEQSRDGGKTWAAAFDGTYTRRSRR